MCHVARPFLSRTWTQLKNPALVRHQRSSHRPRRDDSGHKATTVKKKKNKKQFKTPSCKQKKLRKRLGWQGTDPELLHYRLGRKEQENLQASSQVLKASKADGRKHSGSSYNSLTGLPKRHCLPQVWQQAGGILRVSPFTLGLLWSNSWLFLGCLWKRAGKRTALAPAGPQAGSTQPPVLGRRKQAPFETTEFAPAAPLRSTVESSSLWQAVPFASVEVWYSFTERAPPAKAVQRPIVKT